MDYDIDYYFLPCLTILKLICNVHLFAATLMKVYVAFVGRKPGVYNTWMECQHEVSGFPGNLHSSFPSREEGERALAEFLASSPEQSARHNAETSIVEGSQKQEIPGNSINLKDFIIGALVVVVLVQLVIICKM